MALSVLVLREFKVLGFSASGLGVRCCCLGLVAHGLYELFPARKLYTR